MNKATVKFCVIILITIILSQVLFGCSDTKTPISENPESSAVYETPLEEIDEFSRSDHPDTLPSDLDFNKEKVTVSVLEHNAYIVDWSAEAHTGDIVNDKIYERNLAVEERLNVDIDVVSLYNTDRSSTNKSVNSILAGDDAFSIMNVTASESTFFLTSGTLLNLYDVNHLNFDMPWWNSSSLEVSSFDGKAYLATGEIAFRYISGIAAIVFNKGIATNYGIDDLYKELLDGDWTYEKLYEYTALVSEDINGDGAITDSDLFGFVSDKVACVDAYYIPFNQPITEIKDGYPELVIETAKTATIIENLYKLYYENPGCYASSNGVQLDEYYTIFKENRALFLAIQLNNLSVNLRDSEIDFGLLPYPKYDSAQEGYYSHNRNGYSLYAIPVTCKNTDIAGAVLEAAAAENYRQVMPLYFETALKIKYTRDNESAQVLDIILEGVRCDFTFFTDVMYIFRGMIGEKNSNFTSYYASKLPTYQAIIDDVTKAFK